MRIRSHLIHQNIWCCHCFFFARIQQSYSERDIQCLRSFFARKKKCFGKFTRRWKFCWFSTFFHASKASSLRQSSRFCSNTFVDHEDTLNNYTFRFDFEFISQKMFDWTVDLLSSLRFYLKIEHVMKLFEKWIKWKKLQINLKSIK